MAAQQPSLEEFDVFSFSLTFESVFGLTLSVEIYVFDSDGILVDHQPVWRGKADVPMTEDELSCARIFIGPAGDGGCKLVNLESMENSRFCEVAVEFTPGQRRYQLPIIPENVWRWWLIDEVWRREES